MVNKREINKKYYNMKFEDGIVKVFFLEEVLSEQTVEQGYEDILSYLDNKIGAKLKLFLDITRMGKTLSSSLRKAYAKASKDERFEKIAVFGNRVSHKVMASFVIGAAGLKNARYFNNKEKALKWLKEP